VSKDTSQALRPLSAAGELSVLRRAPFLLPFLLSQGLCLGDALPLAHNATLLSFLLNEEISPRGVLESYSLLEIARLCRDYYEEAAL
jgi:hypothetical protein